ncbi:clostripain-related cysteine peptidase [Microbulbifer halophilus]|uniref:Clostripain-related cysteine peptidase n=1 Tax=Microbulbifer halophilus TaxID=453963 RepID=A0ABW5EBF0_9GAMM|nr:clostripain-related cysteine peptidase [Microbulbifer halophilus]MCW8125809.1 clostripain-related cysteine peptidase [Microbulbifer halophilus]
MTSTNPRKASIRALYPLLAVVALLLFGCDSDSGASRRLQQGPASGETKEWTFLAYMNGDNALVDSATSDFQRMAAADLGGNVNLLVFIDYDASQEKRNKQGEGTGEKYPRGAFLFRLPGGGGDPQLVQWFDELNMDNPATLRRAVARAFSLFPSRRRALLLWDHGGSWPWGFGGDQQDGTLESPRGIRTAEIAGAVRSGLERAALSAPLDLLGFDACLLAGAEVTQDLVGVTRLYLAPAEMDYGGSWNYTGFLSYLGANPEADLKQLGKAEVALWDQWKTGGGKQISDPLLRSQIALDMEAYPDFVAAFADFAEGVRQLSATEGIDFTRAAIFAQPTYSQSLAEPAERNTELRDVGQFLDAVAEEVDALAGKALTARMALAEATIAVSQGDLRRGQSGFHLELPPTTETTPELLENYARNATGFAEATGWDRVLDHYADFNDHSPPTIQSNLDESGNPPVLTFSVPEADAAAAEVDLAIVDPDNPDQAVHTGLIARGVIEPGTDYRVAWDGRVTTLPDGKGGQQLVDVQVWEAPPHDFTGAPAEPPILAIPGIFTETDGDKANAWLLYREGATAVEDIVLTLSPGGASAIALAEAANEGTFTPSLQVISPNAPDSTPAPRMGSPIPVRAQIPISKEPAAAGHYVLITIAADVFGNGAVAQHPFDFTGP